MTTKRALLLSDDLLDSSRIAGAARTQGWELTTARTVDALLERARALSPDGILVHLQHPNLNIADLLNHVRQLPVPPRVAAFGSHVDAARLHEARQAGCAIVLPRSAFFEKLNEQFSTWLAYEN